MVNVLLLTLVNVAVLKLLMFTETYYLFTVRFETCTRDGGMNIFIWFFRSGVSSRMMHVQHFITDRKEVGAR